MEPPADTTIAESSWQLGHVYFIHEIFRTQDFSKNRALTLIGMLILLYTLIYAVYNLYLHPLASFPGPLLARSSLVWRIWHTSAGRIHRSIDTQHKIHGPVFRVSPNELSFGSVGSWKAIYGHAPAGRQPTKSNFYDMYGSAYNSTCIGSERDPKRHGAMKRNLAAAFSTQALMEQEDVIQGCIDGFIEKIQSVPEARGKGLNMTHWYEMISFDVLGEMAFGKRHFWSEMLTSHLFFVTLLDNMSRYPLLVSIGKRILPWATTSVRDKHTGLTRTKVQQRLDTRSSRKDFLTTLVKKVEQGEIEKEEMTAHVSTLVIAGGETSSSFLAAVTYYLLRSPSSYAKLKDEIRSTFQKYSEITSAATQALPYLQAVIVEGLRMFPPGSQGFPRISPGMHVDGFWVPAGTEMYTSAWSVTHNEQYFHQPFELIPERWLDPKCKDVKEASQPFSLGPRGCLGRNFASVEISIILAKMHFTYDLGLVDQSLDWEGQSSLYVNWWKPDLFVRFLPVQ